MPKTVRLTQEQANNLIMTYCVEEPRLDAVERLMRLGVPVVSSEKLEAGPDLVRVTDRCWARQQDVDLVIY